MISTDEDEIIDISPVISEHLAVFPGDVPFKQNFSLHVSEGASITLSSISTTLHIGAHADAPSHYHAEGCDIATRSLSYYIGPCQVIKVKNSPHKMIALSEEELNKITARRVLFRTDSFDPLHWSDDFFSIEPKTIEALALRKVKLVGIDTPSIDPSISKTLDAHHMVRQYDMAILEGLVLNHVNEGFYDLVALPLKIQGGDSSPVRAILLQKK